MNDKQIKSFVDSMSIEEQRKMLKDINKNNSKAALVKGLKERMKRQNEQTHLLETQTKELASLLQGKAGCGCGGEGACSCKTHQKGVSAGELDDNHKGKKKKDEEPEEHAEQGACPVCSSQPQEEESKDCGLAHEISTKILALDKVHSDLLSRKEQSKAMHKAHPEGHWCQNDCQHATEAADLERKCSLIAQARQSLLSQLCNDVDPEHQLCQYTKDDGKAMSSLDETSGGALRGKGQFGRTAGAAVGRAAGAALGNRYGGPTGGKVGGAVGGAVGGVAGSAGEDYLRGKMGGEKGSDILPDTSENDQYMHYAKPANQFSDRNVKPRRGEKLFDTQARMASAAVTGGPLAALNAMKEPKPQDGEKFAAAAAPIARAVAPHVIGAIAGNAMRGGENALHKDQNQCPYCSWEAEPPVCSHCGMQVGEAKAHKVSCWLCEGTGKVAGMQPCPICSGTMWV